MMRRPYLFAAFLLGACLAAEGLFIFIIAGIFG